MSLSIKDLEPKHRLRVIDKLKELDARILWMGKSLVRALPDGDLQHLNAPEGMVFVIIVQNKLRTLITI